LLDSLLQEIKNVRTKTEAINWSDVGKTDLQQSVLQSQ